MLGICIGNLKYKESYRPGLKSSDFRNITFQINITNLFDSIIHKNTLLLSSKMSQNLYADLLLGDANTDAPVLPAVTTTVPTADAQKALDDAAAPTTTTSEPKGQLCALVDLTTISRPGAEHPRVSQTAYFKKPQENLDHYSEYALKVIRFVNKDGVDIGPGKSLEISSPVLQKLLRPFLAKHAFLNLAADPIVIHRPFAAIFHSRADIRELCSTTKDATERQMLELLLEKFCKPYLGETERVFREEVPKGMVRWDLLWTLFQAEDDIIVQNDYFREMHRVMDYEIIEDIFVIYTWRWGYGAGKFGPCSETISIPKYSSTRRIEQLPCFPLRMVAPEQRQQSIKTECIARGRQWKELIRPSHREYHGTSQQEEEFWGSLC